MALSPEMVLLQRHPGAVICETHKNNKKNPVHLARLSLLHSTYKDKRGKKEREAGDIPVRVERTPFSEAENYKDEERKKKVKRGDDDSFTLEFKGNVRGQTTATGKACKDIFPDVTCGKVQLQRCMFNSTKEKVSKNLMWGVAGNFPVCPMLSKPIISTMATEHLRGH